MKRLIRKTVRKFKTKYKGWSAEQDHKFFNASFASQDFDPFTLAYPGYITIKRFADLASPYLKGLSSVLDVGCGPAEITCELAKRYPAISFLGIDHSEAGIQRAEANAKQLKLKNISFKVANAEKYLPANNFDIILMFDAFHHLMDPAGFIKQWSRFTERFLLIEPRGDWKGAWKKELDFDWVLLELDKIRARLDYLTGTCKDQPAETLEAESLAPAEPVEHRYTQDDFQIFFPGYGIKIRGTISGIDVYPASAHASGSSLLRFGTIAYDLYKEIDKLLYENSLDLAAKHWLIYAQKGAQTKKRAFPREVPLPLRKGGGKGPYDVSYQDYTGPRSGGAGAEFKAVVRVINRSFRTWSSESSSTPDLLSYHWRSRQGRSIVKDGLRTSLPRRLNPDEACEVEMRIKAPGRAGRYILAIDMVREGTAWYSETGSPCLSIPFRVTKGSSLHIPH
jgi:SAM-dependent methyltransferase